MSDPGGSPAGRVVRVSGPLVEAAGLDHVAMLDTVEMGPLRTAGEAVGVNGDLVTVQAFEYTGGLRVGDPVVKVGQPLSARLGPGLLGGVFDGLLRRLSDAPVWLSPERSQSARDPVWSFTPSVSVSVGTRVEAGAVLGVVANAGAVEHRVLCPPGVSGELTRAAAAGLIADDTPVIEVGDRAVRLVEPWPVRRPRPFRERLDDVIPLGTGQRVLDLLFPLARGSAAAVPGGFGTGKTVLLQQVAKWCDADVIVYVGCGERGNEMADVLSELADLSDPRTGGPLLDRTVVIANTSNMPMMARESSIYAAMTVAEYYRDMGYEAVVIADSTSRWAEALREFASRSGALPAEEGYPANLASALAAFYERAGRVRTLGDAAASVTVVAAVSPPGGDMTDPVTTNTQRFVRAFWTLDRDLAYARHYPAVSWAASFARDTDALAEWQARHGDPSWGRRRARAAALLAEADRLTALVEIVGTASLPPHERVLLLAGRLLREAVLMQSALSPADATCAPGKQAALLDAVLDAVAACQESLDRGVRIDVVEAFDFGPLVRARDEFATDDADGVHRRRDDLLAGLRALS